MRTRRDFLRATAASTAMMAWSTARSQTPARLRLIVAGPAGGAVDVAARLAADQLKESGYLAIVENAAGAAGQIAVDTVRRAAPDGTTLLVTPPGVFTIYPHIYEHLAYRASDFVGVATLCGYQFALAVGPSAPVKQMNEFLAWAKANPKLASYGTPGAGTEPHFIGTEIVRLSGVPLIHVPYRGGAQAVNDLVGGNLPSVISALPNFVVQQQAGKIRVLAMTGTRRSAFMPEVPTMTEAGFPELTSNLFYGVFASASVPVPVLSTLSAAFAKATQTAAYRDSMQRMSLDSLSLSRTELASTMSEMSTKWAGVVKRSGFNPEK